MTDKTRVHAPLRTISFGEHFQASQQFDDVFKTGMALVERTAAYLDGSGRKESKGLPGHITVLYATESMRLTTRLLDLASWLLIRRALKDGEITEREAEAKRTSVKLQSYGRPSHIKGFDELPTGLRDLIVESFALHDRIVQLDRAFSAKSVTENADDFNPVAAQRSAIERAFRRAG
ncbi:MAG: protease adaptor protein RcdA [Hyphomicrobium sp.]